MDYPKYTKEQNLSCKLSDKDIKKIRRLFRKGMRKKEIAKEFNVTESAIYYQLLTNEQKRAKAKKNIEWQNRQGRTFLEKKRLHNIEVNRRKEKIMGEQMNKYRQSGKKRFLINIRLFPRST